MTLPPVQSRERRPLEPLEPNGFVGSHAAATYSIREAGAMGTEQNCRTSLVCRRSMMVSYDDSRRSPISLLYAGPKSSTLPLFNVIRIPLPSQCPFFTARLK